MAHQAVQGGPLSRPRSRSGTRTVRPARHPIREL